MDDLEWMEIRQHAYDCVHTPCKNILTEWCKECKIECIAYDISLSDKKVVVYTRRPGIMIGYQGKTVFKYQDMFREEYGDDFKVEFKEIKGNFIIVDEEMKA